MAIVCREEDMRWRRGHATLTGEELHSELTVSLMKAASGSSTMGDRVPS